MKQARLTRRGLVGSVLGAGALAAQTPKPADTTPAPQTDKGAAEGLAKTNAQAVAAAAGDPQADPSFRFQP